METLEPGHRIELTVDPERKDHLEVLVLRDDAPVGGALVALETEEGTRRVLTSDSGGRAEVSSASLGGELVRVCAHADGEWATGPWQVLDRARESGMEVSFGDTGSLALVSEAESGVPSILGADGWDVSRWLPVIGRPHRLGPDRDLQVVGLPVGRYQVRFAGTTRDVLVDRGGTASLVFP